MRGIARQLCNFTHSPLPSDPATADCLSRSRRDPCWTDHSHQTPSGHRIDTAHRTPHTAHRKAGLAAPGDPYELDEVLGRHPAASRCDASVVARALEVMTVGGWPASIVGRRYAGTGDRLLNDRSPDHDHDHEGLGSGRAEGAGWLTWRSSRRRSGAGSPRKEATEAATFSASSSPAQSIGCPAPAASCAMNARWTGRCLPGRGGGR